MEVVVACHGDDPSITYAHTEQDLGSRLIPHLGRKMLLIIL